jgi:predicted metal-dependent phosphoesterase TrpH
LIDLHLHTTASDGVLAPSELVTQAVRAGITTLSVTDHDTITGLDEARVAASHYGVGFVTGIEITAIERGRDVHMLGYFFEPGNPLLRAFLDRQRAERRRRIVDITARLTELGYPLDVAGILDATHGSQGRSLGRPALADALVAAGHVNSRSEAFDLWLGEGKPAFVPREGPRPFEVIDMIHQAGGLVSLAHPGLLKMDDIIDGLAAQGLDAVEARHSDHDPAVEIHYRNVAARLDLAVSGGSDFHGEDGRQRELGEIVLPQSDFARLSARARLRTSGTR